MPYNYTIPDLIHGSSPAKESVIMSSPISAPADGNRDRGQAAVIAYWTQTAIAIVFVAGRFYARRMIRSTGLDDWFMLVTLVSLRSYYWVLR